MRGVPLGGGGEGGMGGKRVLSTGQGERYTSDAGDKGTESSILWGGGG
jgi:hypothetical protein